ncbi:insulinase family protein [Candidatus Parcubacteria bacterium]|jgi:predicted Zn-dependent peptidase|nr:insulinase family protein [Candidatus Parcubacteria bacterium]
MFKRIVRKDGSVIILVPKRDTKAITFEVIYKVGSRQETKAINGASHFVEHLMFKGTDRRPNTANIAKELDSVGAEYNAFTGKEYTGYYITADSRHMPLAVDMLSDMLYNSKFEKKEVDRERGVIVEEINMYEDNPLMYMEDVFENLLFKDTVLGRSIAGPRVNIQTIPRNSLYNYYQKHYFGGNAVIGVAGKFTQAQALKLVDKLFPIGKKQARNKIKAVPAFRQTKPEVKIVKRDLEQVQLMLGFRTISSVDPKFMTAQLLGNILGATMSSRLFLNIRERRGLCYFIRASIGAYEDIGSFVVHAGLNKEKVYEALEAIKEELNDISSKGITKEELKKAKDNIRGRMVLKMENANSHLNFLMSQELLGQQIKDLEAKLKEMDKITIKQVNDLAKQIVKWPQANLAIIGPFENKNKFLKILSK